MTDVDNNWGDGVKMYMTNFTIHDWDRDFPASKSFCRSADLIYQTYPVLMHENIIDDFGNKPEWDGNDCERVYMPMLSLYQHTRPYVQEIINWYKLSFSYAP